MRNGVRRFFPSAYAIDRSAAPAGAPQFDVRKQAATAIEAMRMQVVHVHSGGFMDLMLDRQSSASVDAKLGRARLPKSGCQMNSQPRRVHPLKRRGHTCSSTSRGGVSLIARRVGLRRARVRPPR